MKVLVYGSKEFGRVIKALARECGHECLGFIDDFSTGPEVIGTYAHARTAFPPASGVGIVMAIGYRQLPARWQAYQQVARDGYAVPTLVHPAAIVHPDTTLGAGAI